MFQTCPTATNPFNLHITNHQEYYYPILGNGSCFEYIDIQVDLVVSLLTVKPLNSARDLILLILQVMNIHEIK